MKTKYLLTLFFTITIFTKLFSSVQYNVLDFGAKNNGIENTTHEIQSAINRCFENGGGMVIIPKGEYLVGTLNLKSNVEFHFEKGAILKASLNLNDFQKQNNELAGIFYTENADNVSITGNGIIFGQGMKFMNSDKAKTLPNEITKFTRQKDNFRKVEYGLGDGPVYPKERFHQMIVFSCCTNIKLEDFKCVDAPYWTILIVHSEYVNVHHLTIDNNLLIPNSDGIDIISSSNVIVSNCFFSCGDDTIVLAGYANHFGDPGFKGIIKPSQNINVSNCTLRSRSSAIRIGGWDQNDMSNYNFNNITIFDSNCGINLTVRDSGSINHVNFSNIHINTRLHTGDWWGNGEPIKISAMRGVPNNPIGCINDINFDNISCNGENSVLLYASNEAKIENIRFNNFDFTLNNSALENESGGNFDLRPTIEEGKQIYSNDIPIIYIENVNNIWLNNGTLKWGKNMKEKYNNASIQAIRSNYICLNNIIICQSSIHQNSPNIILKKCKNISKSAVKQNK